MAKQITVIATSVIIYGSTDIMLEKPDLQDEKIIVCIQDEYSIRVTQVTFLLLGADVNTTVYRVVADDDVSYFFISVSDNSIYAQKP